MSENASISIENAFFRLGDSLSELRYVSEILWFDSGFPVTHAPALQRLWLLKKVADSLVSRIARELRTEETAVAVRTLGDNIGGFCKTFQAKWLGEARQDLLRNFDKTEWEFQYDRDEQLLKKSPLKQASWNRVKESAGNVSASLDSTFRGLFELGQLLGAEVFPTILGGQRSREEHLELGYYMQEFRPAFQGHLQAIKEDFPYLGYIDFKENTAAGAKKQIGEIRTEIRKVLDHPDKARLYLGLILDRKRHLVRRGIRCSELKMPSRWNLLIALINAGDAGAEIESLQRALVKGRNVRPTPDARKLQLPSGPSKTATSARTALDKAVSDVNKVLRGLGVEIKGERDVDKRLVEMENI